MQYRKLGNTDIEVSAIAFGSWAIVGDSTWGPQDEQDAIAALRTAHDIGTTFFDTAEMYGNGKSEELIGKALADVRDEIVIASKVVPDHYAPAELRAACERSLGLLKTDYMDLYQLHWPKHDAPIAEPLGVLQELKEQGKIRAYGVSNFGPIDLGECFDAGYAVESNQLCYSLLFRAIEFEILPLCAQKGISVLTYSSMAQGLLTGKFASADDVPEGRARTRLYRPDRPQSRHHEEGAEEEAFEAIAKIRKIAEGLGESMADVALAWLLAQDGVTSVIAGTRSPDQARRNAHAADIELPDDAIRQLAAATEPVKQKLGPNADMWDTESRIR